MKYSTFIQPDELQTHLDDPTWAIVDCRFDLQDNIANRHEWTASTAISGRDGRTFRPVGD